MLEQSKQSIRTCISYPKGRWRRLPVAVLIRKTVGISPVFKFKTHVTLFFDFKSLFLVLQLPSAEREHDTHGILSKCYPEPSEGFTSSKPDRVKFGIIKACFHAESSLRLCRVNFPSVVRENLKGVRIPPCTAAGAASPNQAFLEPGSPTDCGRPFPAPSPHR